MPEFNITFRRMDTASQEDYAKVKFANPIIADTISTIGTIL